MLKITPDLEISFLNAGHILGSAMVKFIFNGKKILLPGTWAIRPRCFCLILKKVTDIDYLIMESVYGDRNHESRGNRRRFLEEAIEDNYNRKGTLIIPTFSLERSQELLFELNTLVENNRIPIMPIFLDSPLAIRLTEVLSNIKIILMKTRRTRCAMTNICLISGAS